MDHIRVIRENFINRNKNNNNNSNIKSKNNYFYFSKITLELYYIIIKMFMNFIYNYNDTILNKIIYDKVKYPNINSIDSDNICFLFSKNEFGRLIFKITIYILTIIKNNYNEFDNKRIILIQRIGMEILQYSLINNDNYFINIIGSLPKFNYYFEKSQNLIINIKNNQFYKELIKQSNLIKKSYYKYFNFEINIQETLEIINNSLNFVLGDSSKEIFKFDGSEVKKEFNIQENLAIITTNYYSLISKVINIISNHQNRKENFEKDIEEYQKDIDNNTIKSDNKYNESANDLNKIIQYLPLDSENEIIKKIIYFYFCFVLNSSDNSFLILSYYIFRELIKLPLTYSQLIFKLLYICIKNITNYENNTIIIDQVNIIIRLYNYLENLINEKNNINQNTLLLCIYYFLQILDMTLFTSRPSLSNILFYKIQYILFTLAQKYKIVDKYFNIIENDSNIQINSSNTKNNIDQNNIEFNINVMNLLKAKTIIPVKQTLTLEFYKKSLLKKIFLLYMKLINNCFDFSIELDRKKIEEIINVEKIILVLRNNYKINLDIRTEFLRFLRKFLIDLKYNFSDNKLYTEIMINSEEYFNYMKNNPLINNLEYPAQLLNFLNKFYNITAKTRLKEKIEKKINLKNLHLKNNNILENDNNNEKNFPFEISDLEKKA